MKIATLSIAAALAMYPLAAQASCLDEVRDFSLKICGDIDKSGSRTVVNADGKLDANISSIIRRIVGGGSAELSGSALIEKYENVVAEQLGPELFNVRDCRQKMVDVAVKQVCQKSFTYNTCSRPEFGQVGWSRKETISQSSGWRGGGSNPQNWCNELINQTIQGRSIGPQHKATVIATSEDARWTGIRHRQYNYSCQITIEWQPVFAERQDPVCGISQTN